MVCCRGRNYSRYLKLYNKCTYLAIGRRQLVIIIYIYSPIQLTLTLPFAYGQKMERY